VRPENRSGNFLDIFERRNACRRTQCLIVNTRAAHAALIPYIKIFACFFRSFENK